MKISTLMQVAVVLFSCSIEPAAHSADRELTTCQLKDHSDQYIGKDVSIRGEILSDGMHGIYVTSNDCKKGAVRIAVKDDLEGSNAYVLTEAVMRLGDRGTVDKDIEAVLHGTVARDGDWIVLDLTSVASMTISYKAR